MTFRVLLFARAREIVDAESVMVAVPPPATVADLRARLASDRPALSMLLQCSAMAVNREFVDDSKVLSALDEIALIPPVSGG